VQFLNGNTAVGGGMITNNPFDASWSIAASGKFKGDGQSDLVWRRNSDGLTEIQFLNGTTGVGGGVIENNPFGADWSVAATGDFNGDGHTDIVWQRSSDGLVEIQFLNGTTPIGGGVIQNNPFGAAWHAFGAGDFNGDGKSDLVFRRDSDGVTEVMYLNGLTPIGCGIIDPSLIFTCRKMRLTVPSNWSPSKAASRHQ
jgi:hypothetical protein